MEDNTTINFTAQEVNVLMQLLDLAVKKEGLNVAEAGLFLEKKIHKSVQEQNPHLIKKENENEKGGTVSATVTTTDGKNIESIFSSGPTGPSEQDVSGPIEFTETTGPEPSGPTGPG